MVFYYKKEDAYDENVKQPDPFFFNTIELVFP